MTNRQRSGLAVIVVVLALIAAIASHRTRLVAGAAQAAPVAKPPAVGDCVVDPLSLSHSSLGSAKVTAISAGTIPAYAAQQNRSCTATRYGEVVTVIAAPKPAVVKGGGDDR